jgi:hypothetical protein
MQCPGQDSRYWSGDDVFEAECPRCGHSVEFFKDDSRRKCGNCGHQVLNPRIDYGCATYCPYAEQCLGSLPPELLAGRDDLLKDKVALAMRRYFGTDAARIRHAEDVARHAEEIGHLEKGDMAVIMAAAYLHDIGGRGTGRGSGSVARELLTGLRAESPLIEEVCGLIGDHPTPGESAAINFKVLHDAGLIVSLEEQYREAAPSMENLETVLNGAFLTDSGRLAARKALVKLVRK